MLTAREGCDALCLSCAAEPVQVIGSKFVLYKRNAKQPKIELVKESGK
jgi:RNA-binding protein